MAKTKKYQLLQGFQLMQFFNVNGKPVAVTFAHGIRKPILIRGMFYTDVPKLQEAIESDNGFGTIFHEVPFDEEINNLPGENLPEPVESNDKKQENITVDPDTEKPKETDSETPESDNAGNDETKNTENDNSDKDGSDEHTDQNSGYGEVSESDNAVNQTVNEGTGSIEASGKSGEETETNAETTNDAPETESQNNNDQVSDDKTNEDQKDPSVPTDYPEILTLQDARQKLFDLFPGEFKPATLPNKNAVLAKAKFKNITFSKLN